MTLKETLRFVLQDICSVQEINNLSAKLISEYDTINYDVVFNNCQEVNYYCNKLIDWVIDISNLVAIYRKELEKNE